MPKKLEQALKKQCQKKGLDEEQCNRYVYGGMRKTGWVPSTQQKKKSKK